MGLHSSKFKKDSINSNHSSISDKYRFEDGRRFHNINNSKYFLPNDDEECDRLHMMHFIYRCVWQSNFSAPVELLLNQEGTKILDVGTGAGSWLLEMSTNYPLSKFIGIDISLIQPSCIKPKNAEFIQANVLERLPFHNYTFDFVFQRLLFAGIPGNEWRSVINELVRVLKPGGYIEIVNGLIFIFNERGLDRQICYKLQGYLEEHIQLHNVHSEIKKNYDGDDAKKLCSLMAENYATFLKSVKPKLMSVIGVLSDEYDNLVKNMKDEIIELDSFSTQVRVYAQKR
ncbi:14700_t:CDS:2 [Dentiscutata erythropus]|uniref:14700_t:CDS:1 n=1 Tax=Dentiscutata erythropus TaxID=1348616 RepID=A0A9N9H0X0_9GLOM|nr:14700_t:CDS:2 [Dentiscutata erythropus]